MNVPLRATWPNKEQLGFVGKSQEDKSDQHELKLRTMIEQRSLRKAMLFGYFAAFNDIFMFPILFIWMLFVIKNPLLNTEHLCHCCEGHGLYSCMERPEECCCECRGIGNTLFGTPFHISFLMYCISIGLFELALLTKIVFIFIFNCLKYKSFKLPFVKALSLNNFRYTKDMRIILIIARQTSFLWILGMIVTSFKFQCSCFYPGAIHPIEFGLQYIRYNQLIKIMGLHVFFCGIFLLSRIILLGMIGNIKMKTDAIVFRLHYIQVNSINKKQ